MRKKKKTRMDKTEINRKQKKTTIEKLGEVLSIS